MTFERNDEASYTGVKLAAERWNRYDLFDSWWDRYPNYAEALLNLDIPQEGEYNRLREKLLSMPPLRFDTVFDVEVNADGEWM